MERNNLLHIKLSDSISNGELNKFHCSDDFLNQFLRRKAKKHQKELLAVTYLVIDNKENIVGYYSLSSAEMPATDIVRSRFANGKLYQAYPAIKIGRFAIDEKYKGKGYGTEIMNLIKIQFSENATQRIGSRFLLVDAYNDDKVLSFYNRKNDFEFWTNEDRYSKTRLMYFDLKHTLQNATL